MLRDNLKFLSEVKGLNNSDLAGLAGVTRQRVSQWMKSKDPFINVETKSLMRLCEGLGVTPDRLLLEIPGLAKLRASEAVLLWDRLYPSLGAFYRALLDRDPAAVARLVEVFGLFEAERLLGRGVWKSFDSYSDRIPPARRQELRNLLNEVNAH